MCFDLFSFLTLALISVLDFAMKQCKRKQEEEERQNISNQNKTTGTATYIYGREGDGLAQWLERWTGDPKVEVRIPSGAQEKLSFYESKRLC